MRQQIQYLSYRHENCFLLPKLLGTAFHRLYYVHEGSASIPTLARVCVRDDWKQLTACAAVNVVRSAWLLVIYSTFMCLRSLRFILNLFYGTILRPLKMSLETSRLLVLTFKSELLKYFLGRKEFTVYVYSRQFYDCIWHVIETNLLRGDRAE